MTLEFAGERNEFGLRFLTFLMTLDEIQMVAHAINTLSIRHELEAFARERRAVVGKTYRIEMSGELSRQAILPEK